MWGGVGGNLRVGWGGVGWGDGDGSERWWTDVWIHMLVLVLVHVVVMQQLSNNKKSFFLFFFFSLFFIFVIFVHVILSLLCLCVRLVVFV